MSKINLQKAEKAIKMLIEALGEDGREGTENTPKRVAKFYDQFLSDYSGFEFTTFDSQGYDQMIIQKDISFYSLCEHHLAPFFGRATVAYIPKGRIVGLSKLARTVRFYAGNLQNQERITNQVMERLKKELKTKDVFVKLEATHLCMEMRGVKTNGSISITTAISGAFKRSAPRNEVLNS